MIDSAATSLLQEGLQASQLPFIFRIGVKSGINETKIPYSLELPQYWLRATPRWTEYAYNRVREVPKEAKNVQRGETAEDHAEWAKGFEIRGWTLLR